MRLDLIGQLLTSYRVSDIIGAEKKHLAKILVSLIDEAGTNHEYFSGETTSCPPIPRVGEWMHVGKTSGFVISVDHAVASIPSAYAYHVAVRIKNAGSKM